jgi:hypothetical protein
MFYVQDPDTGLKVKVHYHQRQTGDIVVYERDCKRNLGELFPEAYVNKTDSQVDYFEHGQVVLTPDSKYYKQAQEALDKLRDREITAQVLHLFKSVKKHIIDPAVETGDQILYARAINLLSEYKGDYAQKRARALLKLAEKHKHHGNYWSVLTRAARRLEVENESQL